MDNYKKKYIKYKEKYILLKNLLGGDKEDIRRGASNIEVKVVIVNGMEMIAKKMSDNELNYFKMFQGKGVVTIFKERDLEGFTIMEKLKHIDLYDEKNNKDDKTLFPLKNNETNYLLKYRFKKNKEPLLPVKNIEIIIPNNKLFIELLDTIERINKLGYIWNDLKNDNLGIDDKGTVKIFDFGETQKITENNNFFDLLAFAKLYYNTLINKDFFDRYIKVDNS